MAAKETPKDPAPKTEPAKAEVEDTSLPQPPAPEVSTSTDKDGIERVVTIADPNWEPAPTEVHYPHLEDAEADTEKDTAKDTEKDTKKGDDK